jgi:hypothetical protein
LLPLPHYRQPHRTKSFRLRPEEHVDALSQVGFGVVELFWHSQMQAGLYAIKQHNVPSTYPDI